MTTEPQIDPNAITCRELVALVTEYLEGALGEGERRLFEAHLDHCDGCRHHLTQMRATIATLGRLRESDLTPETRERFLAAFRSWRRQLSAVSTGWDVN
jgi:anti-sigma factor RsiW